MKHPLSRELIADSKRMEQRDYTQKVTTREPEYDDDMYSPEYADDLAQVDIDIEAFLHPTVGEQMGGQGSSGSSLTGLGIMQELTEDRLNRRIRPFTPGPIAAYTPKPKSRPMTTAQLKRTYDGWRQQSQKLMLEKRAKNDKDLTDLKERR